ncbi:MAG: hypothetical protein JWN43_1994, partial [Gammaproteobacteria bacterium]|nr:hypothetical protein [Gammaproteobacteria bacterium]
MKQKPTVQTQHRGPWLLIWPLCVTLAVVGVAAMAAASNTVRSLPDTDTLLNAGQNDA